MTDYEKGRVIVIDDDPKAYVFSNVFEVANTSKPYEKVAVGKNLEYVLEAIRCEGTSEWRATPHDEFALVMDGEVTVELLDPDDQHVDPSGQRLDRPRRRAGRASGWATSSPAVAIRSCCPAGRCYRFHCDGLGVILLQTIEGPDTVERWAEICQTEA